MSEPKINIHIATTADTKALKTATKEIKDQAHELKNSATNVAKAWADAGQKMSKVAKEHAKAVKTLTPPGAATPPAARKTASKTGSAKTRTTTAATTNAEEAAGTTAIGDEIQPLSPRTRRRGRSSATKTTAAKKAAAKQTAARKSAAKKAAAKKASAKREAVKTATAKKTAAQRSATKKTTTASKKAGGRTKKAPGALPVSKRGGPKNGRGAVPGNPWTSMVKSSPKLSMPGSGKLGDRAFGAMLGKGASLASVGLKSLSAVIGKALPPPMQVLLSLTDSLKVAMLRWYDRNEKLKGSIANLSTTLDTIVDGGMDAFADSIGELFNNGKPVADLLDGITLALGGQTEAMKKVNEPLTKYKNATEIAKEAQEKFNDSLEKQRDLLDETRDGLEDRLELTQALMDREESKLERDAETALQKVDDSGADDATKAQQRHDIEAKLERDKYELRRRGRAEEMKVNQEDLQKRRDSLGSAEGDLAKQKSRVELATALEGAKKAVSDDDEQSKKFLNNGNSDPVTQETRRRKRKRLEELSQEAKEKRILTATEEQKNLPKLEENVRLQKAETMALEKKVRQEEQLQAIKQREDADATKHTLKGLAREHGQTARPDPALDTALPAMPAAPPPPPPPPGKARADTSTEATRAANEALRAAHNDNQGDTQKEGAVIAQFQQSVSKESADRGAALQQALQAMLALQQGGSQMERQLTSVLSAYGSKLSQLASTMNDLETRTNNIEINGKR